MRNILDSFEEGKKQSQQWRESLDRSETIINAFQDDFVYSNYDACVNTENFHNLGKDLGSAVKALSLPNNIQTITLIGPRRSGKTTTVRYFSEIINKKYGPHYSRYIEYSDNFWDWWENTDFKETQIFFFDGIFPIWNSLTEQSFNDLENRSKFNKIIVIPIVDTIEYYWLRKRMNSVSPMVFGHVPSTIEFSRSSKLEIIQILKQRYKTIGKSNPFSNDLLKSLSILSLGLPGMALWIARHLLRSVQEQKKSSELTVVDLLKLDNILNFSRSLHIVSENNSRIIQEEDQSENTRIWPIEEPLAAISSSFGDKIEQFKKITGSRLPILREMLTMDRIRGTIKRSELQERTGVKDSSLTYQCQNLVKDDLITYMKDGREVIYQLPTPTKEALELLFFE